MAIEQTQKTIGKLQLGLKGRMPYGPKTIVKTNLEKRQEEQSRDPHEKIELMNKMGPVAWENYMKEIYGDDQAI
tara:strand:- start:171 stop:392 length:222 start_codon:yes stop_codon:yes gene_type:complete